MSPLDSFSTARLRADRLTDTDLPELRRMHADPVVMASLGGVRTEDQTTSYLVKNLQHWAEHGFGLWNVRERGGDEIVGRALLRYLPVDGVNEVEVGYAFYAPYWGKGYATEIAKACVAMGYERLGLSHVVAITAPSNRASQHVLEKAGLVYEREILHEGAPAAFFRSRPSVTYRPLGAGDRDACLRLFDANSPDFFLPSERHDYVRFLNADRGDYQVCVLDGHVVGAVGIEPITADRAAIRWLVVASDVKGQGLGREMVRHVREAMRAAGVTTMEIAASHRSAPFFARFGAIPRAATPHGWGEGMHRVDMELEI
jgi:ribosomal-protein-alanine N-acetyltransferase